MCRPFPAQISIQRSMAKQQLERKMSRSYKSPCLLPKNVTFIHGTKKNLVSLLLLQFFLVLSLFFKQNSLSLPRQPGTSHPHHVHMSSLLFLVIFSISSKLSGHVFLHQGTSCFLQPRNRNLDKSNSREGRFICLRSEFQGIQSVGLKEACRNRSSDARVWQRLFTSRQAGSRQGMGIQAGQGHHPQRPMPTDPPRLTSPITSQNGATNCSDK